MLRKWEAAECNGELPSSFAPPVVVLGFPNSGSRLIANVLRSGGVDMGSRTNAMEDAMCFAPLFERYLHDDIPYHRILLQQSDAGIDEEAFARELGTAMCMHFNGFRKINNKMYDKAAMHVYMGFKKKGKEFKELQDHVTGDATEDWIQMFVKDFDDKLSIDGDGEQKSKNTEKDKTEKNKKKKKKKDPLNVNFLHKLVKWCVENPEIKTGIPALSDVVEKLRGVADQRESQLLDIVLTACDFMSAVFSAPDEPGKPGPKLILKYIQAKSGEYIDHVTGESVHLPQGYAPQSESFWTPATSSKKNHWIDPAFGKDYCGKAPFILMYDPGGTDRKRKIEVQQGLCRLIN